MNKLFLAAFTALTLASTASFAGKAPSEKQLAQQQKMKDCNAEAKTKALKGADRKAFMKTCLSGDAAPAAATPATAAEPAAAAAPADKKAAQQEKMKSCNADAKAKGLKGADRKTFMSSCLSAG